MENKLYRDEFHKKIAGICAGLAEYFRVDVAIVRVLFVLALIFHGGGLLIYIIFWIVLPKKPYIYTDPTVDYTVPPKNPGDMNNPFQGNPFQGNPFRGNPFPNQPFQAPPRNNTSLVGIVIGILLIIIGGSILLDDFDIIPDWDFGQLWPIILVVIGGGLIFAGEQKKPWEKSGWEKKDIDATTEDTSETKPAADTPPADNPPTA